MSGSTVEVLVHGLQKRPARLLALVGIEPLFKVCRVDQHELQVSGRVGIGSGEGQVGVAELLRVLPTENAGRNSLLVRIMARFVLEIMPPGRGVGEIFEELERGSLGIGIGRESNPEKGVHNKNEIENSERGRPETKRRRRTPEKIPERPDTR